MEDGKLRVIEHGHVYGLQTHDGKEQVLTFVKSLPDGAASNHDGVLCQEVLRALIDRVLDLNAQKPCHENIEIINNLRETLLLFEQRAFRNTLNKSYAKIGKHIEQLPTKSNGHLFDLIPV